MIAVAVYVGYRNKHPDEETVQNVLEELKEHNIDVNTLVAYPSKHCQLAESSNVEGMGIGKQPLEIFNILYN
jgi:hypothetical protein